VSEGEGQKPEVSRIEVLPAHPLDTLLTPERAAKYRLVLARRTRRLVLVIEDCHDPHNATAVVRTADAFGVQEVHVTTSRSVFKINPRVSQGSHLHIDVHVHRSIDEAYAALRSRGYRIVASDLKAGATVGPQQLRDDLERQPLALVFGSESEGVSAAACAGADGFFLIPMAGFPQSLNLSVSVAVTVYALRGEALSAGLGGDLPIAEQLALYESWVRRQRGEAADVIMQRATGRNGESLEVFQAE
jgi:tRNA (guanosine-2'-O-)-methyltransferase